MNRSKSKRGNCWGVHPVTVGKDYRFTFPAALLAAASWSPSFVVTICGGRPHWLLYPADVWEKTAFPACSKNLSQETQRRAVFASDATLTRSNRLTLPPRVRTLGGVPLAFVPFAAVLVGLGDHFELWTAEIWEREQAEALRPPAMLAGLCLDD